MSSELKLYLKNTISEISWESLLAHFDQHYTRSCFLKQKKDEIQTILEELQFEKFVEETKDDFDLNSTFSSVSTLIMDVDSDHE